FDVSDRHLVSIAQDRHNQATWAADSDTDVKVAVIDDVFAINRSVQDGIFLQSSNRSLDEEGSEAQLDAVLFFELVFVGAAQIHHSLHVDFVEGCQDGVFLLRLQQALSNTCTQTAHRHTLFWTAIQRQCGRSNRCSCLGRSRSRLCVSLGDTTTTARTFYRSRIDAFFGQDLAGSRRCNRSAGSGCWCCCGSRCSCSSGFCGWSGCRRSGFGFCVDTSQYVAGSNGAAVTLQDFSQNTRSRRRNFQNDFVSFDFDQDFVCLYGFARLLLPVEQRRFRNGFGQLGDENISNGHNILIPLSVFNLLGQRKAFVLGRESLFKQLTLLLLVFGQIADCR